MSRYIIGVLNEFLLNKKANERMHVIALVFMLHAKLSSLYLDGGRPTFELAHLYFHACVKDE